MNANPESNRSETTGPRGARRLVAATRYSMAGLASAWRGEEAFRQEVVAGLALTPVALWLGETPVTRILLIGSVMLVIIVELLNSAIESAIDRIGSERHPLSGRAKDLGSAAVFVSLLLAGITWSITIWGRFAGG